MNNITIKYRGIEYYHNTTLNVGPDKSIISLLVGVNDNYENNDFEITYDASWVSHRRLRNMVDIIISPTVYIDRNIVIVFTHKLNSAIRFELEINQNAPDYKVLLSTNGKDYTNNVTLQFSNLTDKSEDKMVESVINVKCLNGRAFISTIKEYAITEVTSKDYVKVKYDNGLELYLKDDMLRIINHGKANMYYNHYYIVILKNKNDVNQEATIRINYNIEADNFSIQ